MFCTRCETVQPRRSWTPSQWGRGLSTLHPFLGCKYCHASGPPPELVDHARNSLRLRQWDLDDFGWGQGEFLMEFRSRHQDIKGLSHNGGIPAVYPFHPRHWHEALTDTWYFDPSNYVYKKAVEFACPQFLVQSGISNEERIGDTIEAILGLEFNLAAGGLQEQHDELRRLGPSNVSILGAARFWRIMVYHEFMISWLVGHWRNGEDLLRSDEPDTPVTLPSPSASAFFDTEPDSPVEPDSLASSLDLRTWASVESDSPSTSESGEQLRL